MYNFWILTSFIALLLDVINTILKIKGYKGLKKESVKNAFKIDDTRYKEIEKRSEKHEIFWSLVISILDITPILNLFMIVLLIFAITIRLKNGKVDR